MPKCSKIRRKKRQVCVGDLDTEITLQNRAITPPVFGSVDFTETFTDDGTIFAMVNTIDGKTFFDGVNTETVITHEIYIRFDSTVTSETWVELNIRRIDILRVENLDERSEYMKLTCVDRGQITNVATEL